MCLLRGDIVSAGTHVCGYLYTLTCLVGQRRRERIAALEAQAGSSEPVHKIQDASPRDVFESKHVEAPDTDPTLGHSAELADMVLTSPSVNYASLFDFDHGPFELSLMQENGKSTSPSTSCSSSRSMQGFPLSPFHSLQHPLRRHYSFPSPQMAQSSVFQSLTPCTPLQTFRSRLA